MITGAPSAGKTSVLEELEKQGYEWTPVIARIYIEEQLNDCFKYKYGAVFLLDRLKLKQDHARTEDEGTADFIDQWLEKDYTSLGYHVIRVPVMSIPERVKFILDRI